jgi:transposase InsO family protein
MAIQFKKDRCTICNADDKIVAQATRKNRGLYTLMANHTPGDYTFLAHATPMLATWNRHLGHIGYQSIVDMAKLNMEKGMPINLSIPPAKCEHCILGKQVKTPIPRTWEKERAKAPLDIVYSDLTGPEDVPLAGGALYLINIMDDYSSYPWSFTLKKKSDAVQVFKDWKTRVEQELGQKLGIVRTDGGGEFSSAEYESALSKAGVKHQVTAPYTSAQNGKSEHVHRTIMGRAWAMCLDAKLPPNLWGECAMAAFLAQ